MVPVSRVLTRLGVAPAVLIPVARLSLAQLRSRPQRTHAPGATYPEPGREARSSGDGKSPVFPSIRSRIRSACPLCREYSSIM